MNNLVYEIVSINYNNKIIPFYAWDISRPLHYYAIIDNTNNNFKLEKCKCGEPVRWAQYDMFIKSAINISYKPTPYMSDIHSCKNCNNYFNHKK